MFYSDIIRFKLKSRKSEQIEYSRNASGLVTTGRRRKRYNRGRAGIKVFRTADTLRHRFLTKK